LQLWSISANTEPCAHIATSYQIDESNIYRIIRWVENTLVKDGTFSLPRRKTLLKSNMDYEVVLIDTTESPVEPV